MKVRGITVASRATSLAVLAFGIIAPATAAEPDKETLIRDALSAAPPTVASTATVMNWDHNVLKQGSGAYTCYPTDPDTRAKGGRRDPMCLDKVWLAWLDAKMNKKPFKADHTGFAYMLAGDEGSNTDPYATGPTADNQWVIEGPHIMVLVPNPAQLEGVPTDPNSGGAYVMWKGTPYAHVMVPVAERPAPKQ
jgi:hypothetical protein